jgi:hypothetical protein
MLSVVCCGNEAKAVSISAAKPRPSRSHQLLLLWPRNTSGTLTTNSVTALICHCTDIVTPPWRRNSCRHCVHLSAHTSKASNKSINGEPKNCNDELKTKQNKRKKEKDGESVAQKQPENVENIRVAMQMLLAAAKDVVANEGGVLVAAGDFNGPMATEHYVARVGVPPPTVAAVDSSGGSGSVVDVVVSKSAPSCTTQYGKAVAIDGAMVIAQAQAKIECTLASDEG